MKQAERNNLVTEMGSLYAAAKAQPNGDAAAQRMFGAIANLKARKLEIDREIDILRARGRASS